MPPSSREIYTSDDHFQLYLAQRSMSILESTIYVYDHHTDGVCFHDGRIALGWSANLFINCTGHYMHSCLVSRKVNTHVLSGRLRIDCVHNVCLKFI